MSLTDEQRQNIQRLVRSGMWTRRRLFEIATEEMYAPEEIDAAAAEACIDREIEAKVIDERGWPGETDCDRLRALFDSLNGAGLAAVMNAGNTMSDGFEDVDDVCRSRGGPGPGAFGYCFFHSQDLERAVDGAGLLLAFGDFSGDAAKSLVVGQLVADRARAHGLSVEWTRLATARINLSPFVWRMRGMPADEG